jgi:acetoin utilization deacetylase AcuC-like enzyme
MRLVRRLLRRLRPAKLWVVQHPRYAATIPHIPLDPDRANRVVAFLREESLVSAQALTRPRPASLEAILRVHSAEHVASLDRVEVVSQAVGVPLTDTERQRVLDQQRLVTGGTMRAVRLALRTRRPALNLGGGLHHATPTQGMGFCVINDIGIAIAHLRHYGFMGRVLVIDLDLHDGNGTRAIFANDPTVHTFSIHNAHWEPQGGVATTAIALGPGVEDETLLGVLHEALPPVITAHQPDLVIYVAGTDPAEDDRLGDWKLTAGGMLQRDRFVVEEIRRQRGTIPIAIVLAGGYGRDAWRYTARFAAWLAAGRSVEPPDDLELILRRYRRSDLRVPTTGEWGLTEEDLFAVVPGAGPGTRVLGTFSRHAIELSLEQVGLLDRVRERGFANPTVDIAFGSGLGETIRLYGDAERAELLMELRVNRSRSVVPGMEVLYIEWLKLQNPRLPFTATSPRLPGQEHPGLGLLREVTAWLVVVCEILGLDGLASTPAQYYMAVVGRQQMRFLDPAIQARFEGLYGALARFPLPKAEEVLAAGRVIDAESGASATWEPAVQVFPVSERMRELVETRGGDEPTRRPRFVLVE